MRIVFSFLPAVMVARRRRLRANPRWIIFWSEADSLAVRLRHCADREQPTTRHNRDDNFHDYTPIKCNREAERSEIKSEAVFRATKVECNRLRLLV